MLRPIHFSLLAFNDADPVLLLIRSSKNGVICLPRMPFRFASSNASSVALSIISPLAQCSRGSGQAIREPEERPNRAERAAQKQSTMVMRKVKNIRENFAISNLKSAQLRQANHRSGARGTENVGRRSRESAADIDRSDRW